MDGIDAISMNGGYKGGKGVVGRARERWGTRNWERGPGMKN